MFRSKRECYDAEILGTKIKIKIKIEIRLACATDSPSLWVAATKSTFQRPLHNMSTNIDLSHAY